MDALGHLGDLTLLRKPGGRKQNKAFRRDIRMGIIDPFISITQHMR